MKFEVLKVERLLDHFFAVDNAYVRYEKPNGEMSEVVTRLCVERGDAAAVLVHHEERNAFFLVRQFRYPGIRQGDAWLTETAAGKIESGETPEMAARREVEEELGYVPKELTWIATFYGSPGGMSEVQNVFYAKVSEADRTSDGGGIDDEDVELVEWTVDQAMAIVDRGEVRDAKALVALLWYKANRYGRREP